MKEAKQDLQEIFTYLNSVEDKISQGDKQFYMSLMWQFQTKKSLSSSQIFHLERIHLKYSRERLMEQEQFSKNYSDNYREIALQCAHYYNVQYPRYYGNIVDKVLASPNDHVLDFYEFNKMCENKYAKKIRSAYGEPEKFVTGDIVQIRTNNRIDVANAKSEREGFVPNKRAISLYANKVCMVLQANAAPITRAAKGARIYKVLVTDEALPIFAHESDLKKVRARRKK